MATVKRTNKEVREGRGRAQAEKIASFTEADIGRFAREAPSAATVRIEVAGPTI